MKYLSKLTFVLLLVGIFSCSDYLDPNTPQNKPIESIETVEDLRGLMNGAYDGLSQVALYGRDWILLGDVRTSNSFSSGSSGRFISESLFTVTAGGSGDIWDAAYEAIANCNIIINSELEEDGPQVQQIKGEAYAVRALAHMILLKQYGQQYVDGSDLGIPYITTFAEEENFSPERPTVQVTLDKIGADYQQALSLLDPTVNTPVTQMTYYGALALQSRYYLYAENYSGASTAAKKVIDGGEYSLVPAVDYVAAWAQDGRPAVIFEIAKTQTDNRGINGIAYMVLQEGDYGDVEVTEQLFNIFEDSDVRNGLYTAFPTESVNRVKYRVTGKYPDRYKNTPVIRYAEVILTYAEAQFRLGNTVEALTYLNMIPANRNASLYAVATLDNILLERRKELAMEGLYYWQRLRNGKDITRTSLRQLVSSNEISIPYGDHLLAYPIPETELNANSNIQQNQGYGDS